MSDETPPLSPAEREAEALRRFNELIENLKTDLQVEVSISPFSPYVLDACYKAGIIPVQPVVLFKGFDT